MSKITREEDIVIRDESKNRVMGTTTNGMGEIWLEINSMIDKIEKVVKNDKKNLSRIKLSS